MTPRMSSDRRAELIAAIRERPDDLAAHRVFGDWIAGTDPERGELITLETAIAAGEGDANMRARCDALVAEHGDRWLAPLVDLGAEAAELRRGLVWRTTLVGRAVGNLDAVCRLEPVIELRIDSAGPRYFARAGRSPALAGVRVLTVGGRYPAGREGLLGSAHLGRLDSLWLHDDLGEADARALASSSARPRLLCGRGAVEAARALASSRVLDGLQVLCWRGDAPSVVALAQAPLAALTELDCRAAAAPEAIVVLGARLDRLERIRLGPLTTAGARALVRFVSAGRLRELTVDFEDELAQIVVLRSAVLRGVVALDVPITNLRPRAITALRGNSDRASLCKMWLPKTRPRFDLPGVEIEWEGW